MKVERLLIAGAAALAAGAGCQSSDASLGGFKSSVDGKLQINQLTTAQDQTLCGEVQAFATSSGFQKDAADLACRLTAIFGLIVEIPAPATDADVQSQCQTFYDMCTTTSGSVECAADPSSPRAATCAATVAEYAACVNDGSKAEQMQIANPPDVPRCDQLTVAFIKNPPPSVTAPAPDPPASCQLFNQKCPAPN